METSCELRTGDMPALGMRRPLGANELVTNHPLELSYDAHFPLRTIAYVENVGSQCHSLRQRSTLTS